MSAFWWCASRVLSRLGAGFGVGMRREGGEGCACWRAVGGVFCGGGVLVCCFLVVFLLFLRAATANVWGVRFAFGGRVFGLVW